MRVAKSLVLTHWLHECYLQRLTSMDVGVGKGGTLFSPSNSHVGAATPRADVRTHA